MPEMSGSLPEVSGDVSVPSADGGLDVGVAVPSVDLNASLPSASGGLSGECKSLGFERFFLGLFCCASPIEYRGAFVMIVYETCAVSALRTRACTLCSQRDIFDDRVYFVLLYLLKSTRACTRASCVDRLIDCVLACTSCVSI